MRDVDKTIKSINKILMNDDISNLYDKYIRLSKIKNHEKNEKMGEERALKIIHRWLMKNIEKHESRNVESNPFCGNSYRLKYLEKYELLLEKIEKEKNKKRCPRKKSPNKKSPSK